MCVPRVERACAVAIFHATCTDYEEACVDDDDGDVDVAAAAAADAAADDDGKRADQSRARVRL